MSKVMISRQAAAYHLLLNRLANLASLCEKIKETESREADKETVNEFIVDMSAVERSFIELRDLSGNTNDFLKTGFTKCFEQLGKAQHEITMSSLNRFDLLPDDRAGYEYFMHELAELEQLIISIATGERD